MITPQTARPLDTMPRPGRGAGIRWTVLLACLATAANAGCMQQPAPPQPGRSTGGPGTVIQSRHAPGQRPVHLADTKPGAPVGEAPADADPGGADAEGEEGDETEAQMWAVLKEVFGREGELKEGVYRLVTPREDMFVTMDGMDVPSGAFLESDFRFWRCPCGKLLVNGQFVLAEYEVNDVVDEIGKGGLDVVAIAPLLLHEHPRLLMVRFQGEGRTRAFADALKSALSYTGEERNAPQPVDLSPDTE